MIRVSMVRQRLERPGCWLTLLRILVEQLLSSLETLSAVLGAMITLLGLLLTR